MNKEYYSELVNDFITNLIDLEDDITYKTTELASSYEYHNSDDNVELSSDEIKEINELRKKSFTLNILIGDLNDLLNK